jgi:hypothetical protein
MTEADPWHMPGQVAKLRWINGSADAVGGTAVQLPQLLGEKITLPAKFIGSFLRRSSPLDVPESLMNECR